MRIVSDLGEWKRVRGGMPGALGFVPTMGDLHAGHMALVARARAENTHVAVSVFVNPAQFNQPADFEAYRRTLEADCAKLREAGADAVFAPSAADMYPGGYGVRVAEGEEAKVLEGEFRPGHFDGVLTVVCKLFNLVRPSRAYFGEKDFQQLLLVRKMVAELFMPVEIVGCPTLRMENGLALSSRNARLPEAERARAAELYRILVSNLDDAAAVAALEAAGFKPEYVATRWGRRLGAAWLGGVRLIDNVAVEEVRGAAVS